MSTNTATSSAVDQSLFSAWYRRNRDRSREIFGLLADETYYSQPISLRNPIVFYDGHLPAFSFNTLVKKALGRPSIDARLEQLFARGIDPNEASLASSSDRGAWPDRETVRAFISEADSRVLDALEHDDLDRPGHPLLDRRQAVFAILEHEQMHQETLLYMWHRLPFEQKRKPAGYSPRLGGRVATQEWVDIPPGQATLGIDRDTQPFGWDNEHQAYVLEVPPFAIERHDVTNAAFLAFVDAGGYANPEWWRPEDWAWIQQERVASVVLGTPRRPLVLARHVRAPAAAAVLAGLRQLRRGLGVCRVARRPPAD